MTLLNPMALLFGLVIGILLLIHFQRRARRLYPVSSPELWQAAAAARDTRPFLKRTRKSWLLLLQIMILSAIILALARPTLRFWITQGRTIVLIMDCSASMATLENGRTRFDLARSLALPLLAEIRGNDLVIVVQARPQPLLDRFKGSDVAGLRRLLDTMVPTHAPVDLHAAVVLALSAAQQAAQPDVFVFSDGTRAARLPESVSGVRVRYLPVGETGNNVAISRFSVRPLPYSMHDREVLAGVANYSGRPQTIRFRIFLDSRELLSETASLEPAGECTFVTQAPAGAEGVLRGELDAGDDLDADNRAYAVLGSSKTSILLVTEGNAFLESALRVNPGVVCRVLKPAACSPKTLAEPYDIRVLDGYVPAQLPPGNYWIIHTPATSGRQPLPTRTVGNLVFRRPSHPVAAFVDLRNVMIDEASAVAVPANGTALIAGNGLTVLAVSENGAGRTVESGFDLRSSNLPLTPAFPVLVSNIVNWLSGRPDNAGDQVATGAPITIPRINSGGRGSAEVTLLGGTTSTAAVAAGTLTFAGTETTGIYTVRSGDTLRRFAVNLFDASESDISPAPAAAANSGRQLSGTPVLEQGGFEVWRILLCMALALLALEWAAGGRMGSKQEPRSRRDRAL